MNRTRIAVLAIVMVLAFGLAACDEDLGSRGGDQVGFGNNADVTRDAEHVIVYRNVKNAPNIFITCTGGIAWAATSSADLAPSMERAKEFDFECTGHDVEGQPNVTEPR